MLYNATLEFEEMIMLPLVSVAPESIAWLIPVLIIARLMDVSAVVLLLSVMVTLVCSAFMSRGLFAWKTIGIITPVPLVKVPFSITAGLFPFGDS